jgi:hypothetical protein
MKKITIIGLLWILCAFSSHAQKYSFENLQKTSIDDLNEYLRKAKNNRNIGFAMLIAGPALCVTGSLLMSDNYVQGVRYDAGEKGSDIGFAAGVIMFLWGFTASVSSVPIIASNSIRIGKIRNVIINHKLVDINIEPNFQPNYNSRNFNSGFTLRVRF